MAADSLAAPTTNGDGRRADTERGLAARQFYEAFLRIGTHWAQRPLMKALVDEANVELEPAQLSVLSTLASEGPMRLGELAAVRRTTASSASKVVDSLVVAGLVSRRVPLGDRRVTVVELTPAGEATAGRVRDAGTGLLERRLQVFDDDELASFGSLFSRLVDEIVRWDADVLARDAMRKGRRAEAGVAAETVSIRTSPAASRRRKEGVA